MVHCSVHLVERHYYHRQVLSLSSGGNVAIFISSILKRVKYYIDFSTDEHVIYNYMLFTVIFYLWLNVRRQKFLGIIYIKQTLYFACSVAYIACIKRKLFTNQTIYLCLALVFFMRTGFISRKAISSDSLNRKS